MVPSLCSRDVLQGEAGAVVMPLLAELCAESASTRFWHFPNSGSVKHCPVVLNHSEVASSFLAIMISFFLSYAFHLEVLEAFNW